MSNSWMVGQRWLPRVRGLARRFERIPNHLLSAFVACLPPRPLSGPLVSVIIATYNRPANLRLAIRSALEQTYRNVEILVVGDGCTDETEQVVRSIPDPRIRWLARETNSGSQSLPNNLGLRYARGTYVAYLGHDDVWLPTHLNTLVRVMERRRVDVATTRAVWVGPPGSNVLRLSGAGILGGRRVTLPPSALCHRLDMVDRVGNWQDYRRLPADQAPDAEFIERLNGGTRRRRALHRVGVIKLPAAWRKDFYRWEDASEQEHWFRRSRSPRRLVLSLLLRSIAADLRRPTLALPTDELKRRSGEHLVDAWRRVKGLPER